MLKTITHSQYYEFDKKPACKGMVNPLHSSVTTPSSAEHNEIINDLVETFKALSNKKRDEKSVEEQKSLALQYNPNSFSKTGDSNNIIFYNLVQECYLELISRNKSFDHNNLETLLQTIVLDYLGKKTLNGFATLEEIAKEIIVSQIEPLYRINSAINGNISPQDQDNKELISNFNITIQQAKSLISEGKYTELIIIENDYSLPAILLIMYFDETSFVELLDNSNIVQLFYTKHLFKDMYDRTLLHHAVLKGKYDIIKRIFEKFDRNELKSLLECIDDYGRTVLHLAAAEDNMGILELLIESECFNLGAKDYHGRTALHLAASNNQTEAMELLLENNTDLINAKDGYGRTALHLAASNNQTEAMELLLENNADLINAKDDHGRTALHLAASNNQTEAMELLLENNANLINAKDGYGNTSLHLAAKAGSIDVLKLLGYEYLDTKQINTKNNSGSTALHHAAYWEHPKAIDILIESGADASIEDKRGHIPLIVATEIHEKPTQNSVIKSKKIIAKLINYDYDVFISPLSIFSDGYINAIFYNKSQYFNESCKEFLEKIYNLLKQNSNIFKPLKSNKQDHIPLINKAVNESNKELIQQIISDFPELLSLSKIKKDKLKESILTSKLYQDNDIVILNLWKSFDFCENSKITDKQYDIFKADDYGSSQVSNLILHDNYSELIKLLKEKELFTKLNIRSENTVEIIKQIILFTCSDSFKTCQSYNIEDVKSLYCYINPILYINGDLDFEIFLAGNEILEVNLWSE